jgi:hypothetical protein
MSTTEIVGWALQIVKAVVDAISVAVAGPEPPSLAELQAKVHAAIDARSEDWIKAAKADADKALYDSAEAEFSTEMQKELKK